MIMLNFLVILILKNKIAGIEKKVITNKLNAYKPIIFKIWKNSICQEKL